MNTPRFIVTEWLDARPRLRYPLLFITLVLLLGIAGGVETGALLP